MKMLQICNRISRYPKVVATICLFAGVVAVTAQPVELLNATNTQWRYMAPTNDPLFGTDWKDSLFGDAGPEWSSGVGLFGTEGAGIYPYPIVTPINSPNFGTPDQGPVQAFFRTHFNWNGSTQGVLLSFTNYVDDAIVIFLNGTEIYRFNVVGNPGDPVQFNPTFQAIEANPLGEPQIIVVTIDPTAPPSGIPAALISGDNIIAVYTTQFQQSSSDNVFGMWMYGSQCIPATVQHPPTGGTNITVEECRTLTMTVQASGLPVPALQWLHLGVPILDATNTSLTVINVRPGVNDGAYTVDVTNSCGAVTSPAFNVTITLDTTAPTLISAVVNETRTQITTSWSEPLKAPDAGNDEFLLLVQENPAAPTLNDFSQPLTLVNGTNLVIPLSPGAWVEGTVYRVFDSGGGAEDACTEIDSVAADFAIEIPFIIRQGVNGYADALDIEIHQNTPDAPNATAASITVDREDPAPFWAQGLLRFNNIFGNGAGQIPLGATIHSATLTLNQNNPGSLNNGYRMLIDWTAESTWNSFNNGVTNDGVEAVVAPDFAIPNAADGARNFDVTATLQVWQGGQPNYGWAIISTGTDGLDFNSSDNVTESVRPTLTVDFTRPPDTMLSIATDAPATATAEERSPFSISWAVDGNNPDFRWQREVSGVYQDIAGQTTATYSDASGRPSESGNYRAYACNSINCVTSRVVAVTVNPDTRPPGVVLVTVGQDQSTVVLRFDEPVTSAGNYTISPNVGITSATLGADNQTVTVVTGPRVWRTTYTLNASGAQDTAETPNNMVATNVVFEQDSMIITGFFEDWKYETNNLDGAAWMSPTFNDALWFIGPGIFGFEPSGTGSNTLRNAGLTLEANGYQPATRWDVNANQPTYYVRKVVTVAGPVPADTVFEMQHYIDDGGIAYVNGTEAFRMGFTNGQVVTFTNYSAGAPVGGEATIQTNTLPLVAGNNLVAVEIHQQNDTSSDVVFGARIVAVHRILPPTLSIVQSGANVTVSWTPATGQLEESADLVNWSNSSRANGLPAPPAGGQMFYRVLR